MIKYILIGFITKLITGIDDTLTQIPLISYFTKTKKGKFAYSLGIISAISIVILLSILFMQILIKIPYYRYFVSGFIFLIAIFIYFDIFKNQERENKHIKKLKSKKISNKKFFKILSIGFLASFTTILDDVIAFSSILLENKIFVLIGIFSSVFLEIFLIFTFSEQINKLKYKKEISVVGLIILSILIFFKII